ncbi:MAG: GDSL-type esterase/lipase family protein [Pirellulaceae bacterium]
MNDSKTETGHVVLLGDSIFDNAVYVPGKPPVVEQLRCLVPAGWEATLLAVDGHVTSDVSGQLARLPADSTHLVVSVGGNDALQNSHIIDARVSAAEGFDTAAEVRERFRRDYRRMLDAVMARKKPTVICTIYDAIHGLPRSAITALSIFNDVILREGFRLGLPILDLRLICDDKSDYSELSPIEPSEVGGAKIAETIKRVVMRHDFKQRETVVYGKPRGEA